MTPTEIGYIGIGVLFVLLAVGMPIGFTLLITGFIGFAILRGIAPALSDVATQTYRTVASYDWSVAPLFVLMGEFCFFAGISTDLYKAAYTWMGRLRGGLAMATVAACAAFASVSGSSVATAVTLGTTSLPEMKRYKYDSALSTGCIAAGGTMGILIPPSIGFIIYGIITEQSIGRLFLAGIIPGAIEAILYIAIIYVVCKKNPLAGPPGASTSFTEKMVSLKDTWIVVLLFAVVMGGIYLGVFSTTEAGGIGAFGAFLFALGRRRLSWKNFNCSLDETVRIGGMAFMLLIGATVFKDFLAISRLPTELSAIISGLAVNRYVILSCILFMYLILGCFMTGSAMILLTMPIIFPIIISLGFDPIWFGVLMVAMSEIASITPPVGLNVFVIYGVAKDVPLYTIFRGIVPFLMMDITRVILYITFPQLSLFIPNMMKGKG